MKKKTAKKKSNAGRKRLFRTPEALQSKVDKYFKENEKFAVGKLGYYLGFADRQSLKDYIDRKDEFSCIIKKAKYFIEGEYELLLQENNVTGIIFALKNMGWKDKQEISHTVGREDLSHLTEAEMLEYFRSKTASENSQ